MGQLVFLFFSFFLPWLQPREGVMSDVIASCFVEPISLWRRTNKNVKCTKLFHYYMQIFYTCQLFPLKKKIPSSPKMSKLWGGSKYFIFFFPIGIKTAGSFFFSGKRGRKIYRRGSIHSGGLYKHAVTPDAPFSRGGIRPRRCHSRIFFI